MSQSTSSNGPEPATLRRQLDALAAPPRLILRALDDLHTVANHLPALTAAAAVLPRTEDELSASIERLRDDVKLPGI